MHLADSMENQPFCFNSSEVHSPEADTRACPAVIRVDDLIGGQGHPKPTWEYDERPRWAVLKDRHMLAEVRLAKQAGPGDEFDQQRDLTRKRLGHHERLPSCSTPCVCLMC